MNPHNFDGTESRVRAFRPPNLLVLVDVVLPGVLASLVLEYVRPEDALSPIEDFAKRVCIRRISAAVTLWGAKLLDELQLAVISARMSICAPPTLKSLILTQIGVELNWGEDVLPAGVTDIYASRVARFPFSMNNTPNVESIRVSNIAQWGHVRITGVAANLRKIDCDNICGMVEVYSYDMPGLTSLYLSEVNDTLTLSDSSGSCNLESLRAYNASGEWDFGGLPPTIKSISLVNVVTPVGFAGVKYPEDAVFIEVRGSPPKISWS